ncbi:MAG: DUF3015 domain-containing protein [Nitrospirales bacterium]|nr:DUF3015 domain-containing protein [Nitrospira sp.]MDR4500777.1 DUF3015 domain-containing protein [Nitrospirales bacterium]
MSKKLSMMCLTCVLSLGITGLAFGNPPNSGPGCGLGHLAWSGSSANQNAIGIQVLMATTNGTFGSQTFGISTGTSGCTNDGTIVMKEKVNVFAAVNFENLSQEMAQGKGEHLASMATLMGIPEEHHAEFFSLTQEKYSTLIKGGETSPKAVVKALHDSMVAHPVLAKVSTP